jgi:selenide,water dikinase
MEDACVFRLDENNLLVQTVDYFSPIVDDPYDFGFIAAVNALSDVYAMGGKPLTAMNIVGFPSSGLDNDVLVEILRGGADALQRAGAVPAGGHTIKSPELFYGLAVTGTVKETELLRNNTAQDGDYLVLTKPLGTGVLTTGLKSGVFNVKEIKEVVDSMKRLNAAASKAAIEAGASAATDVTGFGLLGHLREMIQNTDLSAALYLDKIPFFPSARLAVEKGAVPAGLKANMKYCEPFTNFDEAIDKSGRLLLADPQTSGGLMIAINEENKDRLVELLADELSSAVIGRFEKDGSEMIRVRPKED